VPAEQRATGTVLDHPRQAPAIEAVAAYARVSRADQKSDLERQLGRLAEYASREKLTVVGSVSEIGSGPNGHRAKVMRLLADASVHTIVCRAPRPHVLVRTSPKRRFWRPGASWSSWIRPR